MGGIIKVVNNTIVFSPGSATIAAAAQVTLAAAQAAIATAAAASVPTIASTAKIANKFAAGKAGKGSLLQRSTLLKGYGINNNGGAVVNTNFLVAPGLPCSEIQGIAASQAEYATTRTLCFKDKDGTPICHNLAVFTATFTVGSPNFTVTAWRQGNPGLVPPGAPAPLTTFGTSDPLMAGMQLYDDTHTGNNSVIPANAVVNFVGATPYSTSTVYTMMNPDGTAANAVSSQTINVQTGGFYPGVPIVPPVGYGATQADATMIYAGTFGIYQAPDDLDFFPTNFAIAAELKTAGGSVNTKVQRSGHDGGVGWGDIENHRPMIGRNIGILGNSAFGHEAWSKTLALLTRGKIAMRGARAARQAHQYLDGTAVTATGGANWNGINPSNPDGAAVAADFAGIEVLLIGTCGPNEQGYATGSAIGNDISGGGRLPYSIGAITENGAACVANVTSNGTTLLVVNSFVSNSAQNPTLVGLKFPVTAPNGLAGRTIASQTTGTTGGVGNYVLDSAAGVGSGTATMMIGSYYGTMNWLLTKLLAFNTTNAGKMAVILCDPAPRYDQGSSNGGPSDPTNMGNPQNINGVRLSDFADANLALRRMWHVKQADIFYNGGFSPFWAPLYYNSDLIHFNDVQPNPIGDRALAQNIASIINNLMPLA